MAKIRINKEIKNRLSDFKKISKTKWLREVALCLLTPQSSPVRAEACMDILCKRGYFQNLLTYKDIEVILRTPTSYVRFHKTKARRLILFLENISEIKNILYSNLPAVEQRLALKDIVNGFGMKEASHALRNIGREGLTILDRHILRCLFEHEVIKEVPKSLSVAKYLEIERKFSDFACQVNATVDELDLYFWGLKTGFIYK